MINFIAKLILFQKKKVFNFIFFLIFSFFLFYLFLLYNIVLVFPYVNMNPP